MECDICGVTAHEDRRFHCPACARSSLYSHRLQHARLLLDRERLGKLVESVLTMEIAKFSLPTSSASVSPSQCAVLKLQHERNIAELQRSRETVNRVCQKEEELRSQLHIHRVHIDERRAALRERQRQLGEAKAKLQNHRSVVITPLEKQTRKAQQRFDLLANDLAYSRSSLCHIAASIVGLRHMAMPAPPGAFGSMILPTYEIAGLPIPDLRTLNHVPLSQIDVVLEQVVRLLSLTCVYLSIQLPAEILPPCSDSPYTWILPPVASYDASVGELHSTAPLVTDSSPGSSQINKSTSTLKPPRPRARPLFLAPRASDASRKPGTEEPRLPHFAREDPTQYAYFIEGVALLASNIAWFSSSQGIPGFTDSATHWQSVSMIGRNMHALFIDAASASARDLRPGSRKQKSNPPSKSKFGKYTHGSATNFLVSHMSSSTDAGTSAFANPQIIRDALRSHLYADMQRAEWHVLGDDDFKPMEEERDVLVKGKGKRRSGPLNGDQGEMVDMPGGWVDESDILARTELFDGEEQRRRDNANAWLKLRDRAGEG